jgi:hypothetical protein
LPLESHRHNLQDFRFHLLTRHMRLSGLQYRRLHILIKRKGIQTDNVKSDGVGDRHKSYSVSYCVKPIFVLQHYKTATLRIPQQGDHDYK